MMQGNVSKKKSKVVEYMGFQCGGRGVGGAYFFWAWIYFAYMYLSSFSMNKMELLDTAGMVMMRFSQLQYPIFDRPGRYIVDASDDLCG